MITITAITDTTIVIPVTSHSPFPEDYPRPGPQAAHAWRPEPGYVAGKGGSP